ncbi:hypothetical protein INE86_03494 [Parabacteroides distasonis]|uniref:hypothetical protein n=1 Tax=Parabacteroides distasonis TaxID=823 RepID=UPI001BA9AEEF|nr:hypothetical protein [Parabacteroides distasonis]QUT54953.1 hypothetical protein INE86_03494 [Parabacteroides distasonis]
MNLTLPEFAFIEGSGHEKGGDPLYGRNVIMHIRSASIIEIFGRKDVALNPDVPTLKFSYTNRFGIKEPMIAALHYCATLDVKYDSEMIKKGNHKTCGSMVLRLG